MLHQQQQQQQQISKTMSKIVSFLLLLVLFFLVGFHNKNNNNNNVHAFTTILPAGSSSSTRTSSRSKSDKLFSVSTADGQEIDEIALEKATKAMTAFTNKYLELSCTKLCSDKSIPAVVIKGLAEHKVTLGAPLCPCRFYDDKVAEAKDGYWNCPCVPMRERQECHCMLFLTNDNDFVGEETTISFNEVVELTSTTPEL